MRHNELLETLYPPEKLNDKIVDKILKGSFSTVSLPVKWNKIIIITKYIKCLDLTVSWPPKRQILTFVLENYKKNTCKTFHTNTYFTWFREFAYSLKSKVESVVDFVNVFTQFCLNLCHCVNCKLQLY